MTDRAVRPRAASPAERWGPARARGLAVDDRVVLGAACVGVCSLPVLLPNAAGNATPADVAMLVAAVCALMWAGYTRVPLRFPYGGAVSILAVAGLIAGLAGNWPTLGMLSVVQDLFLLAWAWTLANALRTARAIDVLLRTWALSSGVWAAAFVVATTRTAVAAGADAVRVGFTFGDQNGAGLYFVLSFLVVAAVRRPRSRALRVVTCCLLLLATLYTGSLGALSGLLLGWAGALVLGVRDRRGAAAAVSLCLAIGMASGSAILLAQRGNLVNAAHNSTNALVRDSIGRGAQSSSERATLRAETYQLWRSSDLVGSGPASTKDVLYADQAPYPKEAHNDWLATLDERGILGAAGLALLVAELVLHSLRTWARSRFPVTLSRILVRPEYLIGGLLCVFAFSLTHEVLHDRTVWTLFGVVAAAALAANRRSQATRRSP